MNTLDRFSDGDDNVSFLIFTYQYYYLRSRIKKPKIGKMTKRVICCISMVVGEPLSSYCDSFC